MGNRIKCQSRNRRISWQNKWLFLQSLSFSCTMHTHKHTISQLHTPVTVSFALWQLKKKSGKEKKLSLKRQHSFFNLAFTRAYSGLWDVGWAARQERWPPVSQCVAGLCIKCFWISTLFTGSFLLLVWQTLEVRLVPLHCDKSHELRVLERIGLLYTL